MSTSKKAAPEKKTSTPRRERFIVLLRHGIAEDPSP
jgi:hypothetical protein